MESSRQPNCPPGMINRLIRAFHSWAESGVSRVKTPYQTSGKTNPPPTIQSQSDGRIKSWIRADKLHASGL